MLTATQKQKEWLGKEILKWCEKGLISKFQIEGIFKEYNIKYTKEKEEEKPVNIIKVLAIIGSILLGLGVILFVASNWQEIPRFIKTIMLLVITFGTFYASYYLTYQKKEHVVLGKALLLLSTLLYGATIFLISQMYNVNANSHWLILFWAFSILPVAYLLESLPAYLLMSFLFIVWDGLFNLAYKTANYYYPLIMLLILLPLSRKKEFVLYLNIFGLGVAQTYAVYYHYHWLILLWSLATLAYYFIYKNNLYSILSCCLFILWNIAYYLQFEDKLPYFYILPLVFFLFLSYKKEYIMEFIISLTGFWLWTNLFLLRYEDIILGIDAAMIRFLILQIALGLLFFGLGRLHTLYRKYKTFSDTYQIISLIPLSIISYILSFKVVHEEISPEISNLFPSVHLIIIGLAVLLLIVSFLKGLLKETSSKLGAIMSGLILLSTLILVFNPESFVLNTVTFNITIFVMASLSIWFGYTDKNTIFFNVGIAVFVILIITRYFDIFWSLLDRSVFFIVGGLMLLIGSIVLERKRRGTLKDMCKKK